MNWRATRYTPPTPAPFPKPVPEIPVRNVGRLHQRWREAGAKSLSEPEDKPWRLREFRAADPDGNPLRVFDDFSWDLRGERA